MPEIKPFKGIRYNPDKIEKIDDVICQPYDQISNKMERDYKNKNPYNFVRLVLTKYAEGHDRSREYRDAKKFVDQWLAENIFTIDEKPAMYPYLQEFTLHGNQHIRKGFICLVRLEELGKGNILPHEKTLSKPKADRLNLLNITKKDFEPIFLLYTDPDNSVNTILEKTCQEDPLVQVTDDKNVVHKVWRLDAPQTIEKISQTLKKSIFVIADGHHRYETGFTYMTEQGTQSQDHPANYKMVTLVNIEDPGLVILPTHRLIQNLPDFELTTFLEKIEPYFNIKKTTKENILQDLKAAEARAFGFYSAQTSYILTLKKPAVMKKFLPDRSKEYQTLDVAILHTLLIEDVLGIAPEKIEDHVRYERGFETAIRRIDNGEFQFVFFMNPTRPEQVKEVAQKKERMPQKSTDFFPKLISGLVFHDVAGE